MKRKFVSLFFVIMILITGSQIASASWDWTDDSQYFDWNGNPIPTPWLKENHNGVDLTDSNKCPYSQGWRLYEKRMTYADQYLKSASTAQSNPYFVLYNIHTSILRFFAYIGGSNAIGEDNFIFKLSVVDGAGNPNGLGLLLNEDALSYSLNEKNTNKDKEVVTIGQAFYKKWVVIDYFLSYDPTIETTPPQNIFFSIDMAGKNIQEVTLDGTFEFKIKNVLNNSFSLKSLLNLGISSVGLVSKRTKDVKTFAGNLKKDATLTQEKGLTGIANALFGAHDLVKGASKFLGPALAGLDVISSFTNILGPGKKVTTTYGKGSIEMNGTIVDAVPITFFSFGIPKVNYSNFNERPDYQGRLGLFSFKKLPPIDFGVINYEIVGEDYWGEIEYWDATDIEVDYMSESYLRSLIHINPETNMELVELKVQPHIKLTTNQFYQNQGYIPGPDGYYKYDHMVDPDILSANYFALLASSEDHFGGGHIGVVDAYYKVYMKFQHKTDPSIFIEVMRTYKADISIRYPS